MGQFKPMVKMTTTEPSVELKLKSGGAVQKKMQMGGALAAKPGAGLPARGGMMPAASPGKPSLADRRRAMKAGPTGAAPAAPVGMAGRMMKAGGETKAMHSAEMKKFSKLQGELKSHEGKPASKAHKGLKTGGVVDGQGGFKSGGIIKSKVGQTTKMDTAKSNHSPAKTGVVKMGNKAGYATGGVAKANGGGYKKGGEAKMAMGGTIPNAPSTAPDFPTARVNPSRRYTSADALRYLRATGDKAGAEQILNAAVGKQSNIPQKAFEMNLGREMARAKVPVYDISGMAQELNPGKPSIGIGTPSSGPPTGIGGNETPPPQTSGGMPNMKTPMPPTPPGGMKKGGAAKKAYATGGLVDSGRPVAMPQGAKKPSKPVSINQLSGTFKRGGAVRMNKGGDVPPKGVEDQIQTARNERAYKAWEKSQAEENKSMSDSIGSLFTSIPRKLKEVFSPSKAASAPGSVTKTEKSVTVTPKKRGGAVTC